MTTMATTATTTFTPFKSSSSDSNLSACQASPTTSLVQQHSHQQQHQQQLPPQPPASQAQHQQQLQQGADTFSSHHASSAASTSSASTSTTTTTTITTTARTAATKSAKSTPRSSTASNRNRTPSSISSGSSSSAMKRSESAMSSASTSGKEERKRKDAIDKVLQRAEIARITRHFKTRLALAAFKAQRGWQDATLDQIEPHLEQEAQRHKQQQQLQQQQAQQSQQQLQQQQQQHMMAQQQFLAQQEAAAAQQQLQYHRSQPLQAGAAFQAQKPPAHYTNGNGMEYSQPYQQPMPMQQPPQQAWGRPGPFDNAGMGPPSFAGHKRARSINIYDQPQQSMAYPANLGAYGSPQPMASTSALQPPVQIGANGGPAMFGDASRPTKRRVLGQEHGGGRPSLHHSSSSSSSVGSVTALGAITELRSPRSRHSATRSSLSRGNSSASMVGRPVSSSDPNFSTFVDAASVLTGLSRGLSDQSDNSDEGMQGGAAGGPSSSSQSNPFGSSIPRPRTPTSANDKGKGAAMHHMSGVNGSAPPTTGGESSAEGAAELMLYLAYSPSPVQSRSSHVVNNIGGEGMMKGRRLFSGSGEDHPASSAAFGNGAGMNGAGGGPNGTGLGSYDEALHPAKASRVVSAPPPGSPPSSMLGPGAFGGAIPSTPGRERQISSSWDAYINVSPSPQRASIARSSEHSYASNGPPPTFLLPNGTPPGSNAPTSTASTTAGGVGAGAAASW
ncbi:hypothetical protein MVLG_02023 [Microbotryum lychnidis-dioicae p1A1 Lamole]|uniref:Uncharacterized protein n=1 Tax=Microbotryum lychnidis-dioicae (strain p1A1 Lamole / MvSl-1064) TaxID=683840 RepID=U5H3W8_USTV1|nr:hypothetical protein MVLG_02023 [Microbotryum lychnidis-dioicae p1A1 Lamole]|eukprot:KDE07751.1 hypothetical protein MVLG_02023 [Microbotryum lychnidis-dioicae p1A1 Lamole]